ncbi:MAG: adenylyltransferase/cytidyltransferase family protein [Chlamydiales bacterium]|nr:adenylyltransferase/cytidyltransferase family protein [Chlamydiia bacterium]MCP5507607.1 adenylyltransferase/cytidyltransferase family protein [Chlamydiales bacterium]
MAVAVDTWEERCQKKYIVPELIEEKAASLKSEGKSIATLNGSFDLLHAGHLHMIYEASKQADVLIVALNTDESIQQYKSEDRPIIPLPYRAQMMAAIGFVGYVTWFAETDPRALLRKISPDVHVNGAEYGEQCLEAEVVKQGGGRIHIVELVPGLSTSEIIKKIKG